MALARPKFYTLDNLPLGKHPLLVVLEAVEKPGNLGAILRTADAAGADAVMMAHVVYPQVAPDPAGYSPHWIGKVLKSELGFTGVVFSDDIGMAAAESAGGVAARIAQHLSAG